MAHRSPILIRSSPLNSMHLIRQSNDIRVNIFGSCIHHLSAQWPNILAVSLLLESSHWSLLFLLGRADVFNVPRNASLIQDRETTISVIETYFDRNLEHFHYNEASYATDCRIYTPDKDHPFINIMYCFNYEEHPSWIVSHSHMW